MKATAMNVDKLKKDIYVPPAKADKVYRNFTKDNAVYHHYQEVYTNQTVEFVKEQHKKWFQFNHGKMTIMEAFNNVTKWCDPSDPDLSLPNAIHAIQTAEKVRELYPEEEEFHLIGFIHDLGKVLHMFGQPAWAIASDTFPVGCRFADECVYGNEAFSKNPDYKDPRYNTEMGVYDEGCGLDNVLMSFGHDEYLYQVLKNHSGTNIAECFLYVIRFHSFYPWHTEGAYMKLCSKTDLELLPLVKAFQKCDLYSKADITLKECNELLEYYSQLADKYVPGVLSW